jgi:hypothetical protein
MILRSQQHHTGEGVDETGEIAGYGHPAWSRHPDIGKARTLYQHGDKQAFDTALKKHQEAVQHDQSFTNDDWGVRDWEEKLVAEMELKYVLTHPEDPKPTIHRKNPPELKHWTDIYYGIREYAEDQDPISVKGTVFEKVTADYIPLKIKHKP